MKEVITPGNLGAEFDLGNIQNNKVRLKLGTGLAISPTGVISSPPPTLLLTATPTYEYANYWVEDAGNLSQNSGYALSWGNGATGLIGLPVGTGNELIAMSFHADNGNTTSAATIELMDLQDASSPQVIHTFTIAGVGEGQSNNPHKYEDLRANPITIPAGAVISFRSTNTGGTVYNDWRVGIWTRRSAGLQVLTNATNI